MEKKLIDLDNLPNNIKIVEIGTDMVKLRSGREIAVLKLPILPNPDFSALVGHTMGDGHIHKDQQHFHFTNKSIELINDVKRMVEFNFGVKRVETFRSEKNIFDLNFPAIIAKLLVILGPL